jgi:hypothetical protein
MDLGITEAVELIGRIATLAKQGVTMELQERIMDLREAVLNVKEELLKLREENVELKRAVQESRYLVFEEGVYWLQDEDDENELEGPYCQKCRDTAQQMVRLQNDRSESGYKWNCYACGKHYGDRPMGPGSFEPDVT